MEGRGLACGFLVSVEISEISEIFFLGGEHGLLLTYYIYFLFLRGFYKKYDENCHADEGCYYSTGRTLVGIL